MGLHMHCITWPLVLGSKITTHMKFFTPICPFTMPLLCVNDNICDGDGTVERLLCLSWHQYTSSPWLSNYLIIHASFSKLHPWHGHKVGCTLYKVYKLSQYCTVYIILGKYYTFYSVGCIIIYCITTCITCWQCHQLHNAADKTFCAETATGTRNNSNHFASLLRTTWLSCYQKTTRH